MNSPLYLGIEIGGTKLQLGLGAGDGTIARLVRRDVIPLAAADGVRSQIVEAFRALDATVEAIGVGFGGPVDAGRGIVITSNQIGGWAGFPLRDWLRDTLGVSVVILQNDADTAALGEARFGVGRGLSPILYVNSGSGIGGGLIVDGKIYRGSGVGAMEIGHLIMEEAELEPGETETGRIDDGPTTLEALASGWGMARSASQFVELTRRLGEDRYGLLAMAGGEPGRITMPMVVRSAREHPRGFCAARLMDATTAMGRALAHAVTLLAPRRVILGGGVSLIGDDLWLDPIRRALDERVFPPFRGTYDVVRAELGEDVVVHGALALAKDAWEHDQ